MTAAPGAPWSGPVAADPAVPGVICTPLPRYTDDRGWLLKVFQRSALLDAGSDAGVGEMFLSCSAKGTIRGLHFQVPPHDHAKTVVCVTGSVLDVVVDLRRGSPTEGRAARFQLDARSPAQLHVPAGVAHGFQALADDTVVAYVVSSEHAPDHDRGIHWDSAGIAWPLPPMHVSPRDQAHPPLDQFRSPFRYQGPSDG
ncbi:MAG: dTDP-4-dehydrorhamnose 3,5-epimerase family protein [Acidimicrobiales bacterium]